MLHPKHFRTLKKIEKNKDIRSSKPNEDLDYFYENGYIGITKCDKPGDYFAQPYLTEKGKARLHEEKRRCLEFWLPVIVSNLIAVAALIISIIALS